MNTRIPGTVVLTFFLATTLSMTVVAAPRSPFDNLKIVATGSAASCPVAPAPHVTDLYFTSKYDGSGSGRDTLSADALATYTAQTAGINAFESGVAAITDRHVLGDTAAAACALAWMAGWAQANALMGAANDQGKAVRKWALGAVAFNYLKIRQAPGLDATRRRATLDWMSRLATRVVSDYAYIDPARMNNHHYWAAAAVAATGIAVDRPDLLNWSQTVYRAAVAQITDDGLLPNELARQSRALEYHNYALAPLVMLAAIGEANGIPALAEGRCGICRLTDSVVNGLGNPAWFATLAGATQVVPDRIDGALVPWVAPLSALCPQDTRLATYARSLAPASARRLGGNLTAIYARVTTRTAAGNACATLWQ